MKKISDKQRGKNIEIAKIKKEIWQEQNGLCFICHAPMCDTAHLLPKSTYPEYYLKKENLVGLCRTCHNLYDNNINFRQMQDRVFLRICTFDEQAAKKYFNLNIY
jgi:5-methylcytosine-specific restriction endonuclease McrA